MPRYVVSCRKKLRFFSKKFEVLRQKFSILSTKFDGTVKLQFFFPHVLVQWRKRCRGEEVGEALYPV